MNSIDLLEIAQKIGENRLLAKNILDIDTREQAESMADIIAWEIKEYFHDKYTTGYTTEQWEQLKDNFFKLCHWDGA